MLIRSIHVSFACLALLLSAALPRIAAAQGFMVEPMRMDISASAGQAVEVPLSIRNTAADGPRDIDLTLVELSQHANGAWNFRPAGSITEIEAQQSSLAWTGISEADVEIAPLEPAEVMVRLEPPRNARGAYFAALLAETPAPEEGTPGVSVRVRFLIPIIIEIKERPVRQNVQLDEIGISYENAEGRAATTRANLRITNAGETYSRVTGEVRIERRSGDRWRLVTRYETRERPIIPGVTLELVEDLERRLPSGDYRVRADVRVDGRRLPPLQKEIEFEGDPTVDSVAYDTELRLTPEMVRMDVVPGATRTTILRIENPGENAVTVDLGATTPRGLLGVRMGDLTGTELSAEPWTSVRPSQLTLRGRASQNVRVISAVPSEEGLRANYYADLTLSGTYADGQSAGQQSSVVHLVNQASETQKQGVIETLSLAEAEASQFAVQARFVNTGNTHVSPLAHVVVTDPRGQALQRATLTGTEGMLLPLGQRTFGGELDFSSVEPGKYALRVSVDLEGGETATLQHVIKVQHKDVQTDDGTVQQARVTVLENAELPEPEVEENSEED